MAMKKVFNVPRIAAEVFSSDSLKKNLAWISISEEGVPATTNEFLDTVPNLKLEFWDLTEEIEFDGRMIGPPSDEMIGRILDFLSENSEKNILVNCAGGISRSGAVAQFCADFLGHEWPQSCKNLSLPNRYIYRRMVELYQERFI